MLCPKCDQDWSTVIDSRPSTIVKDGRRRRYQCNFCKHRWTTIEMPADDELVKKFAMNRDVNDAVLKEAIAKIDELHDILINGAFKIRVPSVTPVAKQEMEQFYKESLDSIKRYAEQNS